MTDHFIPAVVAAIKAIPNFGDEHVVEILAAMRECLPAGDTELALLDVEDAIAAEVEESVRQDRLQAWYAEHLRQVERVERYGVHNFISENAHV